MPKDMSETHLLRAENSSTPKDRLALAENLNTQSDQDSR